VNELRRELRDPTHLGQVRHELCHVLNLESQKKV
jgi:hypothetical protein